MPDWALHLACIAPCNDLENPPLLHRSPRDQTLIPNDFRSAHGQDWQYLRGIILCTDAEVRAVLILLTFQVSSGCHDLMHECSSRAANRIEVNDCTARIAYLQVDWSQTGSHTIIRFGSLLDCQPSCHQRAGLVKFVLHHKYRFV